MLVRTSQDHCAGSAALLQGPSNAELLPSAPLPETNVPSAPRIGTVQPPAEISVGRGHSLGIDQRTVWRGSPSVAMSGSLRSGKASPATGTD